jgi:hypothetical protein
MLGQPLLGCRTRTRNAHRNLFNVFRTSCTAHVRPGGAPAAILVSSLPAPGTDRASGFSDLLLLLGTGPSPASVQEVS